MEDGGSDEFYRDTGVRFVRSPSPGTPRPSPRTPAAATESSPSRIPSIQLSRLKQPTTRGLVKSTTTVAHFGIARGVQQVQPQPSMAYGVTSTTVAVAPPMRSALQRRVVPPGGSGAQLNATKSRSQVRAHSTCYCSSMGSTWILLKAFTELLSTKLANISRDWPPRYSESCMLISLSVWKPEIGFNHNSKYTLSIGEFSGTATPSKSCPTHLHLPR